MPSLRQTIDEGRIETVFHPVLSVKKKALIGLHAVGLGLDPAGGAPRAPESLYAQAKTEGLALDLDRLLRRKNLERARDLLAGAKDILVFLNLDTSIVDLGVVGSGHLLKLVEEMRLDPTTLVIEFTDAGAQDTDALQKFIETYRRHGFLIALNDVGLGHSNLSRIILTRPDILKVSAALVRDLPRNYYNQEILRSLTQLSRKLGALVVATGISRDEEAVAALELGVDMLEEAVRLKPEDLGTYRRGDLEGRLERWGAELKSSLVRRSAAERDRQRRHESRLTETLKEMSRLPAARFDESLRTLMERTTDFECVYVLDEDGVQITETVAAPGKRMKRNSLFCPAQRGADHSSKEYFYLLDADFVNRYVTEPYISLASGNLCITLSSLFRDAANKEYVFCADVPLAPDA